MEPKLTELDSEFPQQVPCARCDRKQTLRYVLANSKWQLELRMCEKCGWFQKITPHPLSQIGTSGGLVAVDNAPGLGFRIESLWAFLAVGDDDDEGLCGAPIRGQQLAPMIAADPKRLESLRPLAAKLVDVTRRRIVLARFHERTDEETFGG